MFVLTFIQRSGTVTIPDFLDSLKKLNPQVAFCQTYPDEVQGAFEKASDALHAALLGARGHGFWVGIGVGELALPPLANTPRTLSTAECSGRALDFSRLAIEQARSGAPTRGAAIIARERTVAQLATGSMRLLYRVCADRTEAEWRVISLLVPGVRGQQKAVAAELGITTQAVSRALVRSCWHEEQAARATVTNLLEQLNDTVPGE